MTPKLNAALETIARQSGLVLLESTTGSDFDGNPTTLCLFGISEKSDPEHSLKLELSQAFDFNRPELQPVLAAHLASVGTRLRNPHPQVDVTMSGIPIAFRDFAWPFHRSKSGADTYVVHGSVTLADGTGSPLHAKVAASMTVTLAELVAAPEQPYAEDFIYNAIRKTLDQGQLEMLKSGNRQPVPVTTRYYQRWEKKFVFTETDEESRREFLRSKVFWLSGVLGGSRPVWIADPRDAQYLNTTPQELVRMAAAEGSLLKLEGEFAQATPALVAREADYRSKLEAALHFTKPTFNESMRSGEANM